VSDRFDSWASNIGTTAAAIALTITVIEQIVQRENRRTFQPRVDRAMQVLVVALKRFVQGCISDYFVRHPDSDISELPDDPLEVLAVWQNDFKSAPHPNIPRWLVRCAGEFVHKVQTITEANRDVLPADIVVAADNVSQSFGGMGPSFEEHLEQMSGSPGGQDWLGLVVVQSARGLGAALRLHDAI